MRNFMIIKNIVATSLLRWCSWPVISVSGFYYRAVCYSRGTSASRDSGYHSFKVAGVDFCEYPVDLDGYSHRITEAGDADADAGNTVVLMGGIPTDSSETFHWLVAELCRLNTELRCLIVQLPFVENNTNLTYSNTIKARYSGRALPFNQDIDLSSQPVDPRFDHGNQAITAAHILNVIGVTKAHFVGHDRGAVVFDYLIGANPDIALSYSRGSQLWDHYHDTWSDLAPELIVGPPHRQMVIPWQCQLLFFAVIKLKRPINLLSPGFVASVAKARRGTEEYDRKTHLLYKSVAVPKGIRSIIRQIMMQTDSTDEVRGRESLKQSQVPIMQFQGEDEFAVDARGTLVSDQPYFGRYNLFANDVCDLYPGAISQDAGYRVDGLIKECGPYRSLCLQDNARLSRFCLIPNAAHFNVVENPQACARAINDFVADFA